MTGLLIAIVAIPVAMIAVLWVLLKLAKEDPAEKATREKAKDDCPF